MQNSRHQLCQYNNNTNRNNSFNDSEQTLDSGANRYNYSDKPVPSCNYQSITSSPDPASSYQAEYYSHHQQMSQHHNSHCNPRVGSLLPTVLPVGPLAPIAVPVVTQSDSSNNNNRTIHQTSQQECFNNDSNNNNDNKNSNRDGDNFVNNQENSCTLPNYTSVNVVISNNNGCNEEVTLRGSYLHARQSPLQNVMEHSVVSLLSACVANKSNNDLNSSFSSSSNSSSIQLNNFSNQTGPPDVGQSPHLCSNKNDSSNSLTASSSVVTNTRNLSGNNNNNSRSCSENNLVNNNNSGSIRSNHNNCSDSTISNDEISAWESVLL